MNKASHMRDRASDAGHRAAASPGMMGALGALAGGLLASMIAKKARDRKAGGGGGYQRRGYRTEIGYVTPDYVAEPAYVPSAAEYGGYGDYAGPDYSASPEVASFGAESWSEPYASEGPSVPWEGQEGEGRKEEMKQKASELKERVAHKAEDLKERATQRTGGFKEKAGGIKERAAHKADELKERATHKAGSVKERVSQRAESMKGEGGGENLREKASHLRERMPSGGELRHRAEGKPVGMLIGGILLGSLAALLLPLSRREKQVMHPAKEKARHQLGDQFSRLEHQVEEKLGFAESGNGRDTSEQQQSGAPSSQGGSFASSAAVPPGGQFTSTTSGSEPGITSRSDLGLGNADEPYRQPSVAEQLDDDTLH